MPDDFSIMRRVRVGGIQLRRALEVIQCAPPFDQCFAIRRHRLLNRLGRRAQFPARALPGQIRFHHLPHFIAGEGVRGLLDRIRTIHRRTHAVFDRRRAVRGFLQFRNPLREPRLAEIIQRRRLHTFVLPGQRRFQKRLRVVPFSREQFFRSGIVESACRRTAAPAAVKWKFRDSSQNSSKPARH